MKWLFVLARSCLLPSSSEHLPTPPHTVQGLLCDQTWERKGWECLEYQRRRERSQELRFPTTGWATADSTFVCFELSNSVDLAKLEIFKGWSKPQITLHCRSLYMPIWWMAMDIQKQQGEHGCLLLLSLSGLCNYRSRTFNQSWSMGLICPRVCPGFFFYLQAFLFLKLLCPDPKHIYLDSMEPPSKEMA